MAESYEATLTSKGQVTVPARLRVALGLKAGDKLVFRRNASGTVEVEALVDSLGALKGIVRHAPRQVSGEDISRWIEEGRGARWPAA